MRSSNALTEYRCTCGKLLCKGRLFLSSVEIKCKRCGQVALFQDSLPMGIAQLLLVRDGEALADKSTRLKEYNGSKANGFRLYVIDETGNNLLV